MTRHVDTSILPKSKRNNQIDWSKSIGYIVDFEYDGVIGKFEIIDYDSKKSDLYFKYENIEHRIKTSGFAKANLGAKLGFKNSEYIYKVGEIIKRETLNIEILKCFRDDRNSKRYIAKCLYDNYEWNILESELKRQKFCPVCCGKVIMVGVNDLATTHPHIIKYLKNKDDGKLYSKGGRNKVMTVCDKCSSEKEYIVSTLANDKYSCNVCSDGVSYPEKLLYNILKQSNIFFIPQKTFDWSQNKRYDFYIPSLNIIIETHGNQHYEDKNFDKFRTLEYEIENDELKLNLAKNNGIDKYIQLDCRISDLEYITNNIKREIDLNFIDLDNLDFKQIEKNARDSLCIKAWELFNNGSHTSDTIAKEIGVSRGTAQLYLKRGADLGLCNYDSKFRRTPIMRLDNNMDIIKEYEALSFTEFGNKYILNACKTNKLYKDSYWMYKSDYDKLIQSQQEQSSQL